MLTFFNNLCFPRSGGGGFITKVSWFGASLKVDTLLLFGVLLGMVGQIRIAVPAIA
jgi:hypothetical protein